MTDPNPLEVAILLEAGSKVIAQQQAEIKRLRAAFKGMPRFAGVVI